MDHVEKVQTRLVRAIQYLEGEKTDGAEVESLEKRTTEGRHGLERGLQQLRLRGIAGIILAKQ